MNALLHWTPGMSLPGTLGEELECLSRSPAESVRLGVAVARALGHHRMSLFDEFPTEEMSAGTWAAFEAGARSPDFQDCLNAHPFVVSLAALPASGDYWDRLRFLNHRESVAGNDDLETGANLRLGLPGRAKQAEWDARNLFMAARLRKDTMLCLGGRVLAIVGSSHKGPMEAALRVLGPDLRIVDLAEVGAR